MPTTDVNIDLNIFCYKSNPDHFEKWCKIVSQVQDTLK